MPGKSSNIGKFWKELKRRKVIPIFIAYLATCFAVIEFFDITSDRFVIPDGTFTLLYILAVVGLHVNTFKPHTGTKTSVLFLGKYMDKEKEQIQQIEAKFEGEWNEFFAQMEAKLKDITWNKKVEEEFLIDELRERILERALVESNILLEAITEIFQKLPEEDVELLLEERRVHFILPRANVAIPFIIPVPVPKGEKVVAASIWLILLESNLIEQPKDELIYVVAHELAHCFFEGLRPNC